MKFILEMTHGQDMRTIEADGFSFEGDWLVFHRRPATGGMKEYWRVLLAYVVSLETRP